MDPRPPHYLRFAKTLALATTLALSACADSEPQAPVNEGGGHSASADRSAPDEQGTGTTTASAGGAAGSGGAGGSPAVDPPPEVDAGKVSGPLPPPEMPTSLA